MWWSDSWPMHWMFFGPLTMIVFVVICMAVMYFMMRSGPMHRDRGAPAIDILKARYARGEIDKAEFEERRRLLTS